MRRVSALVLLSFCMVVPGVARRDRVICGTNPERRKEQLHLHRQAVLARRAARLQSKNPSQAAPRRAASRDMGNIVVIDDSDGVVSKRNLFNLDQKTLTFTPTAAQAAKYQFRLSSDPYDSAAASSGTALPLEDDGFKEKQLAFSFPFFGQSYQSVFINADGNLTFTKGESATSERSLGRMVAGPPRIAGLFDDLNPSSMPAGITVASDATRFIVSWQQVPEYADFGDGPPQTFQIRLYPDGRIQIAFNGINVTGAVVGIAPGDLQGSSSVVSFAGGSTAQYSSTIAERFGGSNDIDVITAAQKFYETHDDTYDYIAFFNNLDIEAGVSVVAWEQTVRNSRTGYGDFILDDGGEYGSPSRLQAVLNLGPISQYPSDPGALVPVRIQSGYNSLKLLAHETGHLFLAYASVRDPDNPFRSPMLGIQQAHWAFNYNAEASVMEGNRIQDNGPDTSPRFLTTATVEQYSPLDQYLMGFRSKEEVPPSFLVTGLSPSFSLRFPEVNVGFNGGRREIPISELVEVEGRRTPDSTIAQRHFRMAFVLIAGQGTTPSATTLAQLENFRSRFEAFYRQAAGNRASLETALRRGLALSIAPAAGVLTGGTITAKATVQQSTSAALKIDLHAAYGHITVPASVTIPAGAVSVNFTVTGVSQGVDDFTATPADNTYDTAHARVQVMPPAGVRLAPVSGDKQIINSDGTLAAPLVILATDANNLFYPGAQVQATPVGGGTVTPSVATADANGQVVFNWNPGTTSAQLRIYLAGRDPASGLTLAALAPTTIRPSGVVNAASFLASLSPGAIGTVFGTTLAGGVTDHADHVWPLSLAGVQVQVNGEPAPLLYVSDSQINFLVPQDAVDGLASVKVNTAAGTSATAQIQLAAVSPGIFFDFATNFGAIIIPATGQWTQQRPAQRGESVDIYCTGLGPVGVDDSGSIVTVDQPQVKIGNLDATVSFSGIARTYGAGLYRVTVQIPQNATSGIQLLSLSMNGVRSNQVKIAIE